MLLHLIALGNIVRVYPGIVKGLTFYLYKNKILAHVVQVDAFIMKS